MKKSFFYFFAVAMAAVMLVSCGKDPVVDPDDPKTETPKEQDDDAIKLAECGGAYFYGTRYTGNEINEFSIDFWTEGMEFDEDGYIISAGKYVVIDFYLAGTTLGAGTYVAATDATAGQVGTLDGEYSYYYDVFAQGDSLAATKGTIEKVVLTATDKGFKVSLDMTSSDGKALKAVYEGAIEVSDHSASTGDDDDEDESDPYAYESETPTAAATGFEIAKALNAGSYEEGDPEVIYLELFDKDTINYTTFELYVPAGSTELPEGEYVAGEGSEGTWYPGELFWGIWPVGSYSLNYDGDEQLVYWWQTGTLSVVKNNDGTYTISAEDIKSYYESTLTFTYTGEVQYSVYVDEEEDDDEDAAAAPRRAVSVKRAPKAVAHKAALRKSIRR